MKNITIQQKATVNAVGEHINGNSKQVLCISNGIIYASASDAAKSNNCSLSEVSRCCRDLVGHVKGNRFCYVSNITNHLDEISDSLQKYSVYAAEQEEKERKERERLLKEEAKVKAQQRVKELEVKYAKVKEKHEKISEALYNANLVLQSLEKELEHEDIAV